LSSYVDKANVLCDNFISAQFDSYSDSDLVVECLWNMQDIIVKERNDLLMIRLFLTLLILKKSILS